VELSKLLINKISNTCFKSIFPKYSVFFYISHGRRPKVLAYRSLYESIRGSTIYYYIQNWKERKNTIHENWKNANPFKTWTNSYYSHTSIYIKKLIKWLPLKRNNSLVVTKVLHGVNALNGWFHSKHYKSLIPLFWNLFFFE
jgi:hypothetical protein